MFGEFFRFELRYWLRGWMVYIFLAIITLLFFSATSSDQVRVGQALGNTHRNAPFVIQMYYAISGILCCLMVTAFVDSAASRDFTSKSSDLLFCKPIHKTSFLLGRFLAASLVALIPTLGVSVGILLAKFNPWVDASRCGPVDWGAHLGGIMYFALPNTLFIGAVIFAISVLTRSTLYSFIGTLMFLLTYGISMSLLEDIENEQVGALLDPLGVGAFGVATKYWAVEEKNTLSIAMTGLLLVNRCIWLSVTGGILAFAFWRFSFSEGTRRREKQVALESSATTVALSKLFVRPQVDGWSNQLQQFWSHFKNDFRGVVRSTVFLVLLCACLINLIPQVWFNATSSYGQSSFPVTYHQVENIRGSSMFFLLCIVTFFAGVLVWRDRDVRFNEILGGLPYPNWTTFLSRFLALAIIIETIFLVAIVVAVLAQLASGYTRLQLDVYFKELLVIDFVKMSFLAMLAFLMHTLAPNKYVGYFLFVIATIANGFVWSILRIETLLVKFGRLPSYTYSDMFGFEPYAPGLMAFGIYWTAFCLLLAWFCTLIAHRGLPASLWARLRYGFTHVSRASLQFVLAAGLIWLAIGGWLLYNTHVLNMLVGSKEREQRRADYEKQYKAIDSQPLPKITQIRYAIDIYPQERNLLLKGTQTIVNKTDGPIDKLVICVSANLETKVEIENGVQVEDDTRLAVRRFDLRPAMQPGESRQMSFEVQHIARGIENNISTIEVNQNGTFFNNAIAPQLGYDSSRELTDPRERSTYKLPKSDGFPALTREIGEPCMRHYVGESDWVDVETVISTSADQMAVAPGSLVEKWQRDGRNYFRYKVDHPSLNFYSFISARYEVAREKWNDVDVEVYYHPEHRWNVPRMLQSIKSALEYCSSNFGPYRHKQARIIEFPRTATFAQAFPGTMPYSESIGFIANLEDPDDIDFVFYVVAHEMAHQWWAHQVIGAKMQGATLLSESLAQYSALMIMEHHYGRDMMRKFLKYEMDRYLSGRGAESAEEKPLLHVNPNQGYVHYQKGSVVLYYLKEMIGEDRVNVALNAIVDKYAYRDPPYPTAYDLIDELQKQMPGELHYLIKDLFENITLFANRTTKATYRTLDNGKFRVTVEVECEKRVSDPKGKSEIAPLHDWIEVGAFAKPETNRKYGKQLYRQRHYIDQAQSKFEFDVDERPDLCGVDPYFLLIDRMPEDNLKRAELDAS